MIPTGSSYGANTTLASVSHSETKLAPNKAHRGNRCFDSDVDILLTACGTKSPTKESRPHIPAGWQVLPLSQIMKKNVLPFDYSSKQPAIDLSVMPSDTIALSEINTSDNFTTNLFEMKKGDILFGSIRPYLHKAGFAPCDGVVTGTVHSYRAIDKQDSNFALLTIAGDTVFDYAVNVSSGTKMPVVSSDSILAYNVPYNSEVVKRFGEISIVETIANNIQENQRLIALRDWLLPMLMNGQATIIG